MPRKVVPPTREYDEGPVGGAIDRHPAFGLISIGRPSSSPGAVLFDSDIRHRNTITLSISVASRRRSLSHDSFFPEEQFIEVQMSEAQWASVIASVGSSGTPCTIRRREDEMLVPGIPFEPRLKESTDEVLASGQKAMAHIWECFERVEERPNKGNLKSLRHAIENAPANMKFAADSLTEHAENVVQKARADVEAMVAAHAEQLGIDPADAVETLRLEAGDS